MRQADSARKRCTWESSRSAGETRNVPDPVRYEKGPLRNPYNRGPSYGGKMSALFPAVLLRGRFRPWRSAIVTQQRRRSGAHSRREQFSTTNYLAFQAEVIGACV